MVTDPSWLYSTIAQSSAAIVAIIGGFITATVLMLTAEKRSLINQLNEKKVRDQTFDNTPTLTPSANRDALKNKISELAEQIKAFSYPPNLIWDLVVLGVLAIFGILVPVIIIACEAFYIWTKLITVILFSIGIFGIFIYIFFRMRELRR